MFTRDVIAEIARIADEHGLEPAALLAVAEVESGGNAFVVVAGRSEPLIRFEGHYFDRRLAGEKLARARKAGLASPDAGAIANPRSQAARWTLLEAAAAIDGKAAYESVSWGLGQVMGAHWAWLGFASVEALVAEARSGAAGQARLMARYILKAGLSPALKSRNWPAFARGYNGPGAARNAYDRKLAAAFARHGRPAAASKATKTSMLLKRGSTGAAVEQIQRLLSARGFATAIDGRFGPSAESALKSFQRAHGLRADGVFGPKTSAVLTATAGPADIWKGFFAWIKRLFGGFAGDAA